MQIKEIQIEREVRTKKRRFLEPRKVRVRREQVAADLVLIHSEVHRTCKRREIPQLERLKFNEKYAPREEVR